jgi:GTP-binding protein
MLHVVVIIGRPNVGKSTLFNRLTRSRNAIVDNEPGVTRDRMHGIAIFGGQECILVDTGGVTDEKSDLDRKILHQVDLALDEADAVIFLADCRTGNLNSDQSIANRLRQGSLPVFLAINKTEGLALESAVAEFHELALGQPFPISAKKGSGLSELTKAISSNWPKASFEPKQESPRLAIIGRPNVGKSTLVNKFLGSERMIVADFPGTTRDSVSISLRRGEEVFVLIDTAGVRRRSRTKAAIERYSVIKTLQAIADCNVAILVLDAQHGLVEQDKAIAGLAMESGKSIVLAVNKWDGLDKHTKRQVERDLLRDYSFLPRHEAIKISALRGNNIDRVLTSAHQAYKSALKNLPTSKLNRVLADAVNQHPPERAGGRPIQLKYAHQGGRNPPIVVIHGNLVDRLSPPYRRYLAKYFARAFDLIGCPIQIETRTSVNPYR